jgi:dihydroorotate dehydrogenase electron transfer subunit
MKDLRPGDVIDLIGPLGKGFHLPEQSIHCLLIGGGVGLAPLWGLAEQLSQGKNRIIALLGFRSSHSIFGVDVFKDCKAEILVTTDDGSYGLKGLASEHVGEVLKRPIDRVYVCGPLLMLKAVIPMIRRANLKGEVSVEEKMGCGYGVCLSCAIDVIKNGTIEKQRVCTEGPVFDIGEIVIGDEA